MIQNSYRLLRNAGLRTLLSALVLCAAQAANGQTASVTLTWQANPEFDIAGYRLYYGIAPSAYTQLVNAGPVTTATAPNLSTGITYFFAVKAYDLSGFESAFSTE